MTLIRFYYVAKFYDGVNNWFMEVILQQEGIGVFHKYCPAR